MNECELISTGFREHPVNEFQQSKHISRFWQKCYYTKEGNKKYFVNIEEIDLTGFTFSPLGIVYEANVQFETRNEEQFNCSLINHNPTIEQIEKFFEDLFVKMECRNYDR